jgi:hypothetical protein
MFIGIRLWTERGRVQRLHRVRRIESVLARNGFDIAAVAYRAKTKLI